MLLQGTHGTVERHQREQQIKSTWKKKKASHSIINMQKSRKDSLQKKFERLPGSLGQLVEAFSYIQTVAFFSFSFSFFEFYFILFCFILFYCWSITVVPIFPPLLSSALPPPPVSFSNAQIPKQRNLKKQETMGKSMV